MYAKLIEENMRLKELLKNIREYAELRKELSVYLENIVDAIDYELKEIG